MADYDPYSMLMGDEPSAEDMARAQAAILRGRSQLGNLEMLSGNPTLSAAGESQLGQSQHGMQQLAQVAENRLQRQTQEDHWKALQAIAEGKREAPKFVTAGDRESGIFDPNTQTFKPLTAPPPQRPTSARGGAGKPGADDKELRDFEGRLSASGAKAGNLGQDYARLSNAQNLKTIIQNGNGVIPPQMVAEATAALGRLVSGGVVTEGTMEKMIPHTSGMALADKLQYITGHPMDAGVKDFLEYMGHTADREAANALQRMKKERLGRISAFGGLYQRNPEGMRRVASNYDLAPGDVDSVFAPKTAQGGGKAQAQAPTQDAVGRITHTRKFKDGMRGWDPQANGGKGDWIPLGGSGG